MVRAAAGHGTYWYAKVLGIFHAQVSRLSSEDLTPTKIQFLWVRWMTEDSEHAGGIENWRLPRVSYAPDGPGAFGFIDPSSVIRGSFLLPGFHYQYTRDLLRRSKYWDHASEGDWKKYYVIMWVSHLLVSLTS